MLPVARRSRSLRLFSKAMTKNNFLMLLLVEVLLIIKASACPVDD